MSTKVTVQDIADALNLSRTTVSKVLNHSPAVSEATRTMVLDKARELGYRMWSRPEVSAPAPVVPEVSCFALVMHTVPGGIHMGTIAIPTLDQQLRQANYSLITCTVSDAEYDAMYLPPILTSPQTKAIVCMELFHPEYSRLLCSLGKPVLFIDACARFYRMNLSADLLLMENRDSSRKMLNTLIEKHDIRTMGFVGDINHCISFRERYEAFVLVSTDYEMDNRPYCIIDKDQLYSDPDWLQTRLSQMPKLPQLFFCANDFLADALMQALERMGKKVPEDVRICGFDGMPAHKSALSRYSTIAAPMEQLGFYAANILLCKLNNGEVARSFTYLKSEPLFREPESTT